ncbi:kinesin motor domain-containing protein 4 [Elsinoe australis]|uniref:Kinesin motor domain-containing protein 4 n=1 Tax=Elsinoe australis TaxID=40998 RepID=A0A4U7AZZ9_9PEZI|nr:kinesin motor domain-containing protein 4 [Elsinoe australis]
MNPPPPPSPLRNHQKRPSSAMRTPRSTSRLSMVSKPEASATASRTSDDDSRTAVKVAIRVRPPLQTSDPGYDLIPQRFRGSTCEVTSSSNVVIQSPQGKKLFVFDRVFDEEVGQQGVWEYISDSVESFVQGYNVSILAYGQSGAGKSYTMGTSGAKEQDNPHQRGIVPRAAAALFDKLSGGPKTGLRSPQRYSSAGLPTLSSMPKLGSDKNWQLKATYVEIYNEQLRDLLVPDSVPPHERPQVSIREDTKGRIILTGLNQVDINSIEDLLDALNFGSSIRQTDATAINAQSSRSHAVFSLNLVQKKSAQTGSTTRLDKRRSVPVDPLSGLDNAITTDSKLHFVDLAGSERLKNTGAQGDRAKEGISINAGLASLGKVISQLSSRSQGAHISYRDSRLTRLLQDSLGGNAITYMVACINPAEFHLSETLNTVTYAQRARAIQSKPQIQQTLSDADKTAMIDRLKAEIASLREIVGRDSPTKTTITMRSDTKANELQDQLISMQENYNALSQRHEKMIAELGLSTNDLNPDDMGQVFSENAVDRLQRSSSLSQAVENVVLEYEKTIQSLESSLSNTRSSLSTTESALNEKESKIAYLEAAAAQSQKRIKKMMDRETHTEQYLQELEGQLEGVASSEESTAALIQGLRKELARAKENQSSTENYIAGLEERLAEAEQDSDIMKRDLERLEQLVDRQRSIGSIDRQTPTIDTFVKQSIEQTPAPEQANGVNHDDEDTHSARASSSPPSPLGLDMNHLDRNQPIDTEHSPISPLEEDLKPAFPEIAAVPPQPRDSVSEDKQAAQSSFMADKVETLTQELFDLRGEHELTVNEFDDLRQKYAIALQTLAKLQDTQDKADTEDQPSTPPHRSDSFLGEALPGMPPQHLRGESLQSLPSEYSSQPDCDSGAFSSERTETPPAEPSLKVSEHSDVPGDAQTPTAESSDPIVEEPAELDVEQLHASNAKLIEEHREALMEVEQLKAELQRSQNSQQASPIKSPFVRRKPSQDLILTMGTVDRANRAFASLRNIALDHFESNLDVRQNFELQLNTIMTELHSRTERAQEVEAEMMTLRRQLEEKGTIIAGLTRERSTLKASSNVDFSAVSHMRDQLTESEQQIKAMQDAHAAQEQQLQSEIATLKSQLEEHLATKAGDDEKTEAADKTDEEIKSLQAEIASWEEKHNTALESMKGSEATLLATIASLEASLKSSSESAEAEKVRALEEANATLDSKQSEHDSAIEKLQQEMQEHLASGQQTSEKLAELEQAHNDAIKNLEESSSSRQVIEEELTKHRDLVADLQQQVEQHQASMQEHESTLQSLKDSHAAEIEQLKAAEEEAKAKQAELEEEHSKTLSNMEAEVEKHQSTSTGLLAGLASMLGRPTDHTNVHTHVKDLVDTKRDLETRDIQSINEKKELEDELKSIQANNTELQNKVGELKALHDEALKELEKVSAKEQKSSRLVAELEDQLNSNYDANEEQTKRLSSMQSSAQIQLQEALHARSELEKEIEDSRTRMAFLESQIHDMRRRSGASGRGESGVFNRDSLSPEAAAIALARSSSPNMRRPSPPIDATALPSPPPAIPLPPLPNSSSNLSALPTGALPPLPNGHIDRGGSPNPSASRPDTPHNALQSGPDPTHLLQKIEDSEARIRTVEKHLYAEKQLTATLEEALVDLETAQNKTRQEVDAWRKKATGLEDELIGLRKERSSSRQSLQQFEEERELRIRAEQARRGLEERMRGLEMGKKKKKGGLNCF